MEATSSMSSTHIWSSPIPYLFGGLALTLILIFTALIILVCSYQKHTSGELREADEKLPKAVIIPLDAEPKIVVIMAGDDMPTYIAKPVTPLPICCDQV
ncbi:protein GLUTAMINE DUMPER 6 [Eucalyptus grandis]|uniref:Uncharacterized protein n=3 Tax=Eucalyptus TaxID=3932 RepID=A0ACC3J525_EUCGR|nr:protein GLUTAMINE DUMPER 6 [Eucalyptus grandis]KAK3409311.1 hypothetical protein EUGRSUZ_J01438 [Eucalyptus grandis]